MTTAKEIGLKWNSKLKALEDRKKEKEAQVLRFGKQLEHAKEENEIKEGTLKSKFMIDFMKDERFKKFFNLDYLYALDLYDNNFNSKYLTEEEQYRKFQGKEYFSEPFKSKEECEKRNRRVFNEAITLINTYKLENTLEEKEEKSKKLKI